MGRDTQGVGEGEPSSLTRNTRPDPDSVGYEPTLAENDVGNTSNSEPHVFKGVITPEFVQNQFQKGQSGNPGGRPRGWSKIAARARLHAPEAIATVVGIMRNSKQDKIRLQAADLILQRGFGKPGIAKDEDNSKELTGEELSDLVLDEILDSDMDGLDS